MTVTTIKDKINAHKLKLEQTLKDAQNLILQGLQEVFNEEPSLQSISWTQYTPYFNDGDACEFSCNAYPDAIKLNGIATYDEEDDEETPQQFANKGKILDDISDIVNSFGDDVVNDFHHNVWIRYFKWLNRLSMH